MMAEVVVPANLRRLLALPQFQLRLVRPVSDEALDRPLAWVHSSDLADPTPWLEPDQLLLTDGAQFVEGAGAEIIDAYFARLRDRRVAGLGFATRVIHDEIPEPVVDAADRFGLPLIEVARGTPFIGIIRHVADVIANERSARLSWSLEAQRAVARAALRPDGLGEILRSLASRLGTWVALYDSVGERVDISGLAPLTGQLADDVSHEAGRLLRKARPAASRIDGPVAATLQTIGQSGRLRGVLAVGAATPLDAAGNDLVGSVIALASISLEQQRALDASRRQIRTGILELLAAGAVEVAERTASAVGSPLPPAPVSLALIRRPAEGQSVLDELESRAGRRGEELFFAERGDEIVVTVSPSSLGSLRAIIERHALVAGIADDLDWRRLDEGLARAGHAIGEASPGIPRRFEESASSGLLGLIRASGGPLVAREMLAPLEALAPAERSRLREAARAWLDANGQHDPAARRLGIHRHTLRARVDQLGRLVGLDLSGFAGRAELWAALELTAHDLSSGGSPD